MYKDSAMETVVTRTIKGMMVDQGLTYQNLCEKLALRGIIQTPSTLRSKVNNGTMAATLFLHIMACSDYESLDLTRINKKHSRLKQQAQSDE